MIIDPTKAIQRLYIDAIVQTDGCLVWVGAVLPSMRYGQLTWEGKHWKCSRLMFFLEYGYLPEVVRHTCDNPGCFHPEHLIAGTQAENMADMVQRGRSAKGEGHSQAKLTEEEVLEMREIAATRQFSYRVIGDAFGVSRCTASRIIQRKLWRHI